MTENSNTFGGSHLDRYLIDYEAPEDGGGEGVSTGPAHGKQTPPAQSEPATTPETPAEQGESWSLTKEEWEEFKNTLTKPQTAPQQAPAPEPGEDVDWSNPAAVADAVIRERMRAYEPAIEATIKERGDRVMEEKFTELEKNPEIGKFDHKLARYISEAMYPELGDPNAALVEGARMASQIRKEYGQAAVEEYKASLKRGSSKQNDPEVGGGAEASRPTFKTYDEVTEHWASQSEV